MGTKVNRAIEIYADEGLSEVAKRTKSWLAMKSRPWVRRPRMELQKVHLRAKYGTAAPAPLKIITVDSDRVTQMLRPNFYDRGKPRYGTFVVGGEWDKQLVANSGRPGLKPFKEYCLCQSTIEHFKDGVDWEETSGYYQEKIDYHGSGWYSSVEDIYESIRERGYRRQRNLDSGMEESYKKYFVPPEYDEIRVNISRDGEVIFDDGRHRFAALSVMDIDEIPVRVFVRHRKWQELRGEIANASAKSQLSDRARRFLDHPDMEDVNDHLKS